MTGKLSTGTLNHNKRSLVIRQRLSDFLLSNKYLAKDPSIVHALNDNRCCVKMLLICLLYANNVYKYI